ncbi:MAG: aminotransferase class I/II-fold pyridoxal phosphate-dependent enzyme [Bacteroidota bacterium]
MKINFAQNQAPLFEELLRYSGKPLIPFHTPGHKRGDGLEPEWMQQGFANRFDLTEITAFDWSGALEKAQMLAADFFQADCSFFLTQGASQGIIGALLGLFAPGDKVLVARNCHLSVINGIILSGLTPVFIETEYLSDWGIPSGIKVSSLQEKIETNPDFKGLIITNPTYQGLAERVQKYRNLIGEKLLIVDEAHGGHLEWSGIAGYNAYQAADLWVHGTHKIMGSLTQTGMLHLRSTRIKPGWIQQGIGLITTTSPSYILLASLDSNRRFLAKTGANLFQRRLPELYKIRSQIAAYNGVQILEQPPEDDAVIDPWKITLSFRLLGLTGFQAAAILVNDFRIQPEYADFNQVTFLLAPWQKQSDFEALSRAIAGISNRINRKIAPLYRMPHSLPSLVMPVRETVFSEKVALSPEKAIGRVSAGIIAPYPPGIPLLIPGELIRVEEIETIRETLALGGVVRGLDPEGRIPVVKENQ